MLRIFLIIFLCLGSFYSEAQVLSTSGTITDSDAQTWNGGSYKVQLYSPNGTAYYNGTIVPTAVQSGALSSSGAFSGLSLYNTNTITPNGAQYSWTICSNTSALCSTFNTSVTSTNLSSALSALVSAPRFEASSKAYGYLDAEVTPTPSPGQGYFNVTTKTQRIWDGTQWIAGGGGGSTPTNILLSQIPTSGLIALYTHADCTNPYKDYSGNNNDGAAISGVAQPICNINGLSYYTSGVLSAWQLPTSATNQAITYIFGILPYLGNTINGGPNQSIMQSSSTGGVLTLIGSGSPGNYNDAWRMGMGNLSQYRTTYNNNLIPSASTIAYSIGTGVSGDKDTLWNNGQEVPYIAQGSTTPAAFNVGNMQVGGNSYPFYGIEGITILYNRKLTAMEHVKVSQAVNNYMQSTSGLVFPRPLALGINSKVICDGDSITFGAGVPNSWCTQTLLNVGETIDIDNSQSTSGKYLAAISIRAPQEVIPSYTLNNRNTVYIFAGTNDIFGSAPPSLVWSNAISAINKVKYFNTKTVWMPMLSRITADANKNTFDSLGIAQCDLYASYCVAPDDPLLYADGAYSNATYFQADGIHPTTAGQTLLALYASNAYKQIYGSTSEAPTIVSAATYTVLASDNYINTTANSVVTLYNCLGYSKFVSIKVAPGLTVTVKNATAAQTIDGVDHSSSALALTANTTTKFQVVPGPTSTGGCTWITR